MKNIFLIDGASGTGKSDLLDYIKFSGKSADYVVKYTNRHLREYEAMHNSQLDLIFYGSAEFNLMKFDYIYEYRGFRYGFFKNQMSEILERNDNAFVIIRSIPTMKQISSDFKECRVIKVYIHSDLSKIKKRLQKQEYSNEQIEFRTSRIEQTYMDYVNNSTFFDDVIINNSDTNIYRKLIDNLLTKYSEIHAN